MKRFGLIILAASMSIGGASGAHAQDPASIQLVGNFNGISCEPGDPANNMDPMGDHLWRKLKFISESGDPDTVFFKFTRDGSYLPMHWGWSGTWGVAEFAWSPPSIGTILADSGYYYFHFNDSDYTYWLDRPVGSVSGMVTADEQAGVPEGTRVTLFDSAHQIIGVFDAFAGDTYEFSALPPGTYDVAANAPGYRDTTVAGIALGAGETKDVPLRLTLKVGVLITAAECERVGGGVRITWCTMECGGYEQFDVYRGFTPDLETMERRNIAPVSSSRIYEFFDRCENPGKDLYYYLIELGGENPTQFGPLFVAAAPAAAASLGQNFPNPFNPATTIPYVIGEAGAGQLATISFYDVSGRLVDSTDLGAREAGEYAFRWNPLSARTGGFPSGVYYCRLQVGKETFTRTVILLR